MTCQEEVVKIGKKLDKMISKGTPDSVHALDMLNTLKGLPITLGVLQKTRIGMTVNNFRKSITDDEVVALAKSVIKSWKKLLPENNVGSGGDRNRRHSSSSSSSRRGSNASCDGDVGSRHGRRDSTGSRDEDMSCESMMCSEAGDCSGGKHSDSMNVDSVRLKCRDMIASALRTPPVVDGAADFYEIASAVEECIYDEFKNTEIKYKNRIRSRIANLKDPKNPRLREHVLLGDITPSRLAVMTSEELASDEMKKLREQLTLESINDHQMCIQGGTKSDLFVCAKCGARDTMYNQLQTRSSDEPMTTFVLCNACGNRWKFC